MIINIGNPSSGAKRSHRQICSRLDVDAKIAIAPCKACFSDLVYPIHHSGAFIHDLAQTACNIPAARDQTLAYCLVTRTNHSYCLDVVPSLLRVYAVILALPSLLMDLASTCSSCPGEGPLTARSVLPNVARFSIHLRRL